MDGEKERSQQSDNYPFIRHNDSNDYLVWKNPHNCHPVLAPYCLFKAILAQWRKLVICASHWQRVTRAASFSIQHYNKMRHWKRLPFGKINKGIAWTAKKWTLSIINLEYKEKITARCWDGRESHSTSSSLASTSSILTASSPGSRLSFFGVSRVLISCFGKLTQTMVLMQLLHSYNKTH